MQVKLISCLFVLDSEKNENIRKNDIKKLKILVDKNNLLPKIDFKGKDMKEEIRKEITNMIGSNIFHLEQVYTDSYNDEVDIIYLGATNIENVKKLSNDYKLIDFKIENNNTIIFDDKKYKYITKEVEKNNNIEYIHEIDVRNKELKQNLLEILISYKKIRGKIDNTDIIFKFMSTYFTLEDVRIVYELIKDSKVDKSNFRKKIIKYCEEVEMEKTKNGHRPSRKFKFKPLKGDAWL